MPNRLWTDQEETEIARQYAAGSSLRTLARAFGGSEASVRNALQRRCVTRRQLQPSAWRALTATQVAEMAVLWKDGAMQEEIATRYGVSQGDVSRAFLEHGHSLGYRRRGRRRERHGRWKGGLIVNSSGYRLVKIDRDHPMWCMANAGGYVAEHRLRIAESLGRPLRRSESVHHVNGDKLDNRLENLQLRQEANHGKGVALRCKDCGSHNVGPVPLE